MYMSVKVNLRKKIKRSPSRRSLFAWAEKLIRLPGFVPESRRKLVYHSEHRRLFLGLPMCPGLHPFDHKRASDARYLVSRSQGLLHLVSNSALPECGQSLEFVRQAVSVDQKSRLRFILQNRKLRLFLVHSLDAPVKPEDAEQLHFGTISVPENALRCIAVI
jgi:hypothetical protein